MRQCLIDAGRKVCNSCAYLKPLEDFHPNKECAGGVTATCRTCTAVKRRKWYEENRARRQALANEKNRSNKQVAVQMFGSKCADCNGVFPPYVYQFHHLDPTQKDFQPGQRTGSTKRFFEELKKCVMLCANCHMIRHHGVADAMFN